jgi:ribonucleoside-diphosphate reductase alpha chain
MSDRERAELIYNLLRASDNLLEYAYYPAKEGEIFNREYRAIGVGVTNLAQLLASHGLKYGSDDALLLQNNVMESVYWHLISASIKLAEERGRFDKFNDTKYKDGKLSFDLYPGPYNYPLKYNWDILRQRLAKSGARFSTVSAIAPTATNSLLTKSSEGIEPIRQLISMKTGNYSCKQLAPNLTKLRSNYEIAWDIDSENLIKMASVRQRWIDQGQSFSLYYKDRYESGAEVLKDIILAETYGLKGLYYAHTPKEDEESGCDSCSA